MKLCVIVVSGVQCVGKTSLAEAVARHLQIPVFSRDPLMEVLMSAGMPVRAGVRRLKPVPSVGLALQTTLLDHQLSIGLSVVLECVAPTDARDDWKRIAARHGARYVAVECVCSDRALHRQRFEERGDKSVGDWKLSWAVVEQTLHRYRSDPGPHLVVDAVDPLTKNVAAALAYISGA